MSKSKSISVAALHKAENARLREGLESAQDSYASECIASHEWESLYNQAQREVIQLRAHRDALRAALERK